MGELTHDKGLLVGHGRTNRHVEWRPVVWLAISLDRAVELALERRDKG